MSCTCSKPVTHQAPGKERTCVKCSRLVDPKWTISDATRDEFFNELEAIFETDVPDWFIHFRSQVATRERNGRDYFGFAYLDKDCLAEAAEEACDLAMYLCLDALRHRRDTGTDDDRDLSLTAAWLAAKAYRTLIDLQAKRKGAV